MKDHALVIFTLSIQTAVGMFISLVIVHPWSIGEIGSECTGAMLNIPLMVVGLLVGLGLLASFFHLGAPMNAWRALSNLGNSWLSREILFVGLFAGSVGLFSLSHWLDLATVNTRSIIAGLAGVMGILLVYSMARVYTLRTIPAWNNVLTPLSFYATTVILGNLAAEIALANGLIWARSNPGLFRIPASMNEITGIDWAILSVIVVLSIKLAFQAIKLTPLTQKKSLSPNLLQLALTTGALCAAVMLVYLAGTTNMVVTKNMELSLWLTFAFALAGEILGRVKFYKAYQLREM